MKFPRRISGLVGACALALLGSSAARAQWQSVTYALKGGWNAIYLHGDATHAPPAELFADHPEVISVWRWNPNPDPAPLNGSSLVPSTGTPEWSVWVRDEPGQTTLDTMIGQSAYLVQVDGLVGETFNVVLPQRVRPPRSTWVRSGANLLGFPSRLNANYPTFSSYFATFPAAIAANTRIYRYAGGDIGPANPIQVFSPAAERVDRNQAYWFEATVVGNFYAPLEITPSNLAGLDFGRTGGVVTVRVRNRTAATVTLTVEPVDSAPPPAGQDEILAAVPLTRRTFNAGTGTSTVTPLLSAFSEPIAPQSAIELTFGLDRGAMAGNSNDLYASLLRFTDSGNLLDVFLPVSARVATLAGLWVGDVQVTGVQSKAPGATGTSTPQGFPLRVLLHVDDDGTVRLLSHVYIGTLAAAPHPLGLSTVETALKSDALASARRLTAAHLPLDTTIAAGSGGFGLGETLIRTVSIPYTARTNPFVHAYHPDHDNRDARGALLPAGAESFNVTRECRFAFAADAPAGAGAVGWGATVIGGTYAETLTGLHKDPLTITGTFELHRVSEIGSITLN